MKNALIVNLFAGPGVGKSMMMGGVFFELKMRGIDCEQSPEFAKDKVWEESYKTLDNQFYVAGKQYHRLKRLSNKVDVIVTDHPLLFSLHYGKDEPDSFKNLIVDQYNKFDNLNIYFERSSVYNPNGRMQTEEEAKEIDKEILSIVKEHCDDYVVLPTGYDSLVEIADLVKIKLKENESKEIQRNDF